MLLDFKIRNFNSIREEVSLSLLQSGKYKRDHPYNIFKNEKYKSNLLKSLIIFGKNAAGKSNLLKAFVALQYLVLKSDSFKINEKFGPYEPFLFDDDYHKEAVRFEIDFITHLENKFNYVIEFNKDSILYESLFFYPNKLKVKLFERKKMLFDFGDNYKGNKETSNLLQNQLFLSKSASNNIEFLNEVYTYITQYLKISMFDIQEFPLSIFNKMVIDKIFDNGKIKDKVLELIKDADTNILDIRVIQNKLSDFKFPKNIPELEKNRILDQLQYDFKTTHLNFKNGKLNGTREMDFESESLGTKKLFSIAGVIIDVLENGGVLIIDELDKSLHPLLTKMLIKLFNDSENNKNNAQLIFATHDSSLLDNDIFRRDQIVFVDKEFEGNTITYKLSDIKGIRKNIPYEKWYLSGRFKAIPVLSKFNLN